MNDLLYELSGVGVAYRHASLIASHVAVKWAFRNLDLRISRGETIGVIGRNGAGKSTLLRLLAGILVPDEGKVVCRAKRVTMLSIGAGFDSYLTGRENIGLNGRLLGMSSRQIAAVRDDIIGLSGIGDAIGMPVRTYSTGMRARLGFAIAYYANPEVLLLDENLGVGDIEFQRKSAELIKEKLASESQTAILVSHSVALIREICSRAIWIEDGSIKENGDAVSVTGNYLRAVNGK